MNKMLMDFEQQGTIYSTHALTEVQVCYFFILESSWWGIVQQNVSGRSPLNAFKHPTYALKSGIIFWKACMKFSSTSEVFQAENTIS